MGRTPTPTNILQARGAFKNHPGRLADREGEPECKEPLGDPPVGWTADQKQAWEELKKQAPWAVENDRWVAEMTAAMMAIHRLAPLKGPDLGHLIALMGRLGMTPSDRTKIRVEKPKKANPFEKIG